MKPKPVIDFSMDNLFREFFDIENFKSQISNDCCPHSVRLSEIKYKVCGQASKMYENGTRKNY